MIRRIDGYECCGLLLKGVDPLSNDVGPRQMIIFDKVETWSSMQTRKDGQKKIQAAKSCALAW